ncbi:MAG: hypothetical protein HY928_11660 [Elusimicrobia bacterium]|nr:hypothetical protein [Elusimicrobiota bacterium]
MDENRAGWKRIMRLCGICLAAAVGNASAQAGAGFPLNAPDAARSALSAARREAAAAPVVLGGIREAAAPVVVGGIRISLNGDRETTGGTLGLVVHHPTLGHVGITTLDAILPPYSDGFCCQEARADDQVFAEDGARSSPIGRAAPTHRPTVSQVGFVQQNGTRPWRPREIMGYGGAQVVSHYDGMTPLKGVAVSKFGAGTGLTTGVVVEEGVTFFFRTLGTVTGLIELRGDYGAFAGRGDAGAVVVRRLSSGELEAVGVIIGLNASRTRAYAVPMSYLREDFGITP